MGQYWRVVNLDRREFINPYTLGAGAKLWEQLANAPGPGAALIILCAAMPEPRGGGDLDMDANWHGPERVDMTGPGKMPEKYPAIAKRTIGRWAGDRIAIVGDYAENGDIQKAKRKVTDAPVSKIYELCHSARDVEKPPKGAFIDISADVARVIEHELGGRFVDDCWVANKG